MFLNLNVKFIFVNEFGLLVFAHFCKWFNNGYVINMCYNFVPF